MLSFSPDDESERRLATALQLGKEDRRDGCQEHPRDVEQLLDLDQDHEHYLEELDDFEDDRNWYPMQDCHPQTNLVLDYNLHWHQGPAVQSLEVFVKLLELGTYLQRLE